MVAYTANPADNVGLTDLAATALTRPISTLVDGFATQDATKWSWGAAAVATGGQLVCTANASYSGLVTSQGVFDLTNSAILVNCVQAMTGSGTGTPETFLQLYDANLNSTSQNSLMFDVVGANLNLLYRNSSGAQTTVATLTYSATTHAWWRIRHSSGTVYWDTSPDAQTWTQQASWASPTIPINAMRVVLGTGFSGTYTPSQTAIFDNVNRLATAPTFVAAYGGPTPSTTTPQTGSVTVAVGDILVAYAGSDGASTFPTGPPTGSANLTWTLWGTIKMDNQSTALVWVSSIATVAETFTLSISSVAPGNWSWAALRFSGAKGVGAVSELYAAVTTKAAITTTAPNSTVVVVDADFVPVAGSTSWNVAAGSFTEVTNVILSGRVALHGGYYADSGGTPGLKSVGMLAPTGQVPSVIALELIPADASTAVASAPQSPTKYAQPTFVGAGVASIANNPATITPALPTGLQNDDLLLCVVHYRDNVSIPYTVPSGWTVFTASFATAAPGPGVGYALRRYRTGDSAPTFTQSTSVANMTVVAQVFAYRNVGKVLYTTGKSFTHSTTAATGIGTGTSHFLPSNGLSLELIANSTTTTTAWSAVGWTTRSAQSSALGSTMSTAVLEAVQYGDGFGEPSSASATLGTATSASTVFGLLLYPLVTTPWTSDFTQLVPPTSETGWPAPWMYLPSSLDQIVHSTTSGAAPSIGTATATFSATPTPGNVLFFSVAYYANFTVTPPAGLTQIINSVNSTAGVITYYRIVQAGDSSTWTFTLSGADSIHVIAYELSGVDTVTPIDNTPTTATAASGATSITTPTATAATAGTIGFACVSTDAIEASFTTAAPWLQHSAGVGGGMHHSHVVAVQGSLGTGSVTGAVDSYATASIAAGTTILFRRYGTVAPGSESGGYGVMTFANGTGQNREFRLNTLIQDITIRATVNFAAAAQPYIDFRMSESGDRYRLWFDTADFALKKLIGGTGTALAAKAAASYSANTDYNINITASGSTIQARMWLAGSAEPSTWDINLTDSSVLQTGDVQLGLVYASTPQDTSAKWTNISVSQPSVAYTPNPVDTVGTTDSIAAIGRGPVVADTVGLTDAVTVVQNENQTITGSPVGITDSISIGRGPVLADAVGLTDTVSANGNFGVLFADNESITGTATVQQTNLRTAADTVGLTDQPSTLISKDLFPADTVGLTDAVTVTQGTSRTVTETIGITDAEAVYGQLTQVITTTANADVEAPGVTLTDVANLSGTAALALDASPAPDLVKGPQRAVIEIDAGSTELTHVVALSGTAGLELSTHPRLHVVHRMTDILIEQVVGDIQPMTLANGPIYADPSLGPVATGGWVPGEIGPTQKAVWRLSAVPGVPSGWGAYLAANPFDDIPADSSIQLSVWVRLSGPGTVTIEVNNDPGAARIGGPWSDTAPDANWHLWTQTFTTVADWVTGYHRLRTSLTTAWIEWSDPLLQVVTPLRTNLVPEPDKVEPRRINRVFTVLR